VPDCTADVTMGKDLELEVVYRCRSTGALSFEPDDPKVAAHVRDFAGGKVEPVNGLVEARYRYDLASYARAVNSPAAAILRGEGVLAPLPAPSVDTGAGLERLASVLQKASTNYDIDLFHPIMARIEEISGYRYAGRMDDDLDTAVRVLCDHGRAATFLISDGVIPS
ncbi:MAG: alanine--tRNA ligase-related protein, partial [Thermoplasmatota archaeon]